jgi:hypothetical protein
LILIDYNALVQALFRNGHTVDPLSGSVFMPTNTMIEPDLYYIPKQSAFYQQQVYVYDNVPDPINGSYSISCIPVENQDSSLVVRGTNFYKPLLNDPAITGVDPIYINSLQKPFNISIDY